MPVIDRKTFENLKDNSGAEFTAELIDTFLADGPRQLAALTSALAAGDAESFRRAAHSLKSNAATFGALELAALARELEDTARAGNLPAAERLAALQSSYDDASVELTGLRA